MHFKLIGVYTSKYIYIYRKREKKGFLLFFLIEKKMHIIINSHCYFFLLK